MLGACFAEAQGPLKSPKDGEKEGLGRKVWWLGQEGGTGSNQPIVGQAPGGQAEHVLFRVRVCPVHFPTDVLILLPFLDEVGKTEKYELYVVKSCTAVAVLLLWEGQEALEGTGVSQRWVPTPFSTSGKCCAGASRSLR